MFTSKIKTTAGLLGVAVAFARSRDSALIEMRKSSPSLVIFDLNGKATDPLGTLAAMHADPGLAAIPTIGFVSHVQAEPPAGRGGEGGLLRVHRAPGRHHQGWLRPAPTINQPSSVMSQEHRATKRQHALLSTVRLR
jgi:hypothetical protein